MRGLRLARSLAGLILPIAIAASAQAGVTYDFQFRSTDIDGNPLSGAMISGGGHNFTFRSFVDWAAAPHIVADVFLRTTDSLVSASVSVVWDNSSGLSASYAQEWFGQGVLFNMMGRPVESFAPVGGVACGGNSCESFDGALATPNGPPSLAPGTYHIGTIVWNIAYDPHSSAVMTQVISGTNGTLGVIDGEVVDLSGSETIERGFYVGWVPEPASAGLLGLGLAGLGLAARRGRSRR